MLEGLFGSRARVAVLARFLLHPEQEYYCREVSALDGLPLRAAFRELQRLRSLGITERRRSGNRVYYRADRRCPIYDELRSILRKTAALADVLRESLAKVASKLRVAFVYGSLARGEEEEGSDVDLFLVGSVGARPLTSAVLSAQAALHREVNTTLLTVTELRERFHRGDPFLTRVLGEPKLFVLGNEDELTRLLEEKRLHAYEVSPAEIDARLSLADRHMADAQVSGLSTDGHYGCAYQAVLVLAHVLLAAAGYRVATSQPGQHATTFAAAAALLGKSQAHRCAYFDTCRRKRHELQYEAAGGATETEVKQLLTEATAFRQVVLAWIRRHRPELLPPQSGT